MYTFNKIISLGVIFSVIGCQNLPITTLDTIQSGTEKPKTIETTIPTAKPSLPALSITPSVTPKTPVPSQTPNVKDIAVFIPTNLVINKEYVLKAEAKLSDGKINTQDITWSVSDNSLGKLDGNKLTPLKEGTIQITATYKNDQSKTKVVYAIIRTTNIFPSVVPTTTNPDVLTSPIPTATPTTSIPNQIGINSKLIDMKGYGKYLYVSDNTNNKIIVIDTTTNTIYKEVTVGSSPKGIAINSNSTKLYVACSGSTNVEVIDLSSHTKTDSINVGASPYEVAVNLSRLYVSFDNAGWSKQVEIYDLSSKTKVGMIDDSVIGSSLLELGPDGNTLYAGLPGGSPAYLWRCDVVADAGTVTVATEHGSIGSNLRDFAISPDGTRAYLACGSPYYIQVINTTNFQSLGHLDTGVYPIGVAISNDGTKAVGANDSIEAFIFNTQSFIKTGTARFSKTVSKLAISGDGTKVYGFEEATSYDKYNVSVITTF